MTIAKAVAQVFVYIQEDTSFIHQHTRWLTTALLPVHICTLRHEYSCHLSSQAQLPLQKLSE